MAKLITGDTLTQELNSANSKLQHEQAFSIRLHQAKASFHKLMQDIYTLLGIQEDAVVKQSLKRVKRLDDEFSPLLNANLKNAPETARQLEEMKQQLLSLFKEIKNVGILIAQKQTQFQQQIQTIKSNFIQNLATQLPTQAQSPSSQDQVSSLIDTKISDFLNTPAVAAPSPTPNKWRKAKVEDTVDVVATQAAHEIQQEVYAMPEYCQVPVEFVQLQRVDLIKALYLLAMSQHELLALSSNYHLLQARFNKVQARFNEINSIALQEVSFYYHTPNL